MTILIYFIIYVVMVSLVGWYFDPGRISRSNIRKMNSMVRRGIMGSVSDGQVLHDDSGFLKIEKAIRDQIDKGIELGFIKRLK